MERIPGKTLYFLAGSTNCRSLTKRRGRSGERIATALPICTAERHHHDIKPSSHHVSPSGECVLIDFGCRITTQLPTCCRRIPSALRHRALYGAGAFARRPRRSAQRLFSLGCAAVLFTTGERPFARAETLRGMRRAALARSLSAAQA